MYIPGAVTYRDDIGDLCERGAFEFRESRIKVTIKFRCFNKEEAIRVSSYMNRHHPEVQFFCTWLNFEDTK